MGPGDSGGRIDVVEHAAGAVALALLTGSERGSQHAPDVAQVAQAVFHFVQAFLDESLDLLVRGMSTAAQIEQDGDIGERETAGLGRMDETQPLDRS